MSKMPKWIKSYNLISFTVKWWAIPWLLWTTFRKQFDCSLTLHLWNRQFNITFLIYPCFVWFITKITLKALLKEGIL